MHTCMYVFMHVCMYACMCACMYALTCHIVLSQTDSVACHSNYNLMQASNLGVVFGPTLIRPEVETVAKINNLKYQNIVVEMMIDEKDKVGLNCVQGCY